MGRLKKNTLYILVDPADKYELPTFVGTLEEIAEHQGITKNAISSAISHAKQRGQNCKYKKVVIKE